MAMVAAAIIQQGLPPGQAARRPRCRRPAQPRRPGRRHALLLPTSRLCGGKRTASPTNSCSPCWMAAPQRLDQRLGACWPTASG